jgi:glycosyltransferase involved in cell wall biosynthesis
MRVLVLSSLSESLINFRGKLLHSMVREGHEVIASAPDRDAAVEAQLSMMGVRFVQTPMSRAGSNPVYDLQTLGAYMQLILRERPGIVLAYTQKPIIYGGIAARLTGGTRFFALVSGLGYALTPASDTRPFLQRTAKLLYRSALKRAECVFLFNRDDGAELRRLKIMNETQRVVQVPGSGVDTRYFQVRAVPPGPPVFLMISRLMRDKGVAEFIEAARLVHHRYPEARFKLLGRVDGENPMSMAEAEVQSMLAGSPVELHPQVADVRPHLQACSVFVLPSHFREGLPRTILEAMAVGRAVIASDVPGCREPVQPSVNGFTVRPRDGQALAEAFTRFLEDPALAPRMGREGRRLAEEKYEVEIVNRMLLSEMGLAAVRFTGQRPAVSAGLAQVQRA